MFSGVLYRRVVHGSHWPDLSAKGWWIYLWHQQGRRAQWPAHSWKGWGFCRCWKLPPTMTFWEMVDKRCLMEIDGIWLKNRDSRETTKKTNLLTPLTEGPTNLCIENSNPIEEMVHLCGVEPPGELGKATPMAGHRKARTNKIPKRDLSVHLGQLNWRWICLLSFCPNHAIHTTGKTITVNSFVYLLLLVRVELPLRVDAIAILHHVSWIGLSAKSTRFPICG